MYLSFTFGIHQLSTSCYFIAHDCSLKHLLDLDLETLRQFVIDMMPCLTRVQEGVQELIYINQAADLSD